jgi:hypothetical protein
MLSIAYGVASGIFHASLGYTPIIFGLGLIAGSVYLWRLHLP